MVDVTKAIGISLIAVLLAVSIPVLISASEDSQSEDTVELAAGDSSRIDDALLISVDDTAAQDVDVTVTALDSQNSTSVIIDEGTEETVSVNGYSVTIKAIQTSNSVANLVLEYDSTMGWSPGAQRIAGIFPIVLTSLAVIVMVLIGARMIQ